MELKKLDALNVIIILGQQSQKKGNALKKIQMKMEIIVENQAIILTRMMKKNLDV